MSNGTSKQASHDDPALATSNPGWMDIVEVSVLIPVITLVITSSTIVLLVVYKNPNLHQSPGFLMAILSVVDLCIISCDSTTTVVQLTQNLITDERSNLHWLVCKMQFIANNYFYGLQSTAVMTCAIDQLIAIEKPLYYLCFKSKVAKFLVYLLLCCWLSLVPICALLLHSADHFMWIDSFGACAAYLDWELFLKIVLIAQYSLSYLIPGGIIVGCYVRIAMCIRRRSGSQFNLLASAGIPTTDSQNKSTTVHKSGDPKDTACTPGRAACRNQLEVCKTLILITILYYTSFCPFFVYQILLYWGVVSLRPPVYRSLKTLRILASLTDGMVFYGKSKTFQAGVKKLFSLERKQGHTSLTLMTSHTNVVAGRSHLQVNKFGLEDNSSGRQRQESTRVECEVFHRIPNEEEAEV